ncbi:hypothetical protein PCE1_001371 [Barthelona sp. PCE]
MKADLIHIGTGGHVLFSDISANLSYLDKVSFVGYTKELVKLESQPHMAANRQLYIVRRSESCNELVWLEDDFSLGSCILLPSCVQDLTSLITVDNNYAFHKNGTDVYDLISLRSGEMQKTDFLNLTPLFAKSGLIHGSRTEGSSLFTVFEDNIVFKDCVTPPIFSDTVIIRVENVDCFLQVNDDHIYLFNEYFCSDLTEPFHFLNNIDLSRARVLITRINTSNKQLMMHIFNEKMQQTISFSDGQLQADRCYVDFYHTSLCMKRAVTSPDWDFVVTDYPVVYQKDVCLLKFTTIKNTVFFASKPSLQAMYYIESCFNRVLLHSSHFLSGFYIDLINKECISIRDLRHIRGFDPLIEKNTSFSEKLQYRSMFKYKNSRVIIPFRRMNFVDIVRRKTFDAIYLSSVYKNNVVYVNQKEEFLWKKADNTLHRLRPVVEGARIQSTSFFSDSALFILLNTGPRDWAFTIRSNFSVTHNLPSGCDVMNIIVNKNGSYSVIMPLLVNDEMRYTLFFLYGEDLYQTTIPYIIETAHFISPSMFIANKTVFSFSVENSILSVKKIHDLHTLTNVYDFPQRRCGAWYVDYSEETQESRIITLDHSSLEVYDFLYDCLNQQVLEYSHCSLGEYIKDFLIEMYDLNFDL